MATRHAVSADCDGARLDSVRSTDICTIRNRHESAGIHRKTEPLRGPARLPKRATPRPAEPREGRRRVKPRDYYELEPDNWRCTAGREGCGGPVSRGGVTSPWGGEGGGVQLCGGRGGLVTVFIDVDDDRPSPAEREVADAGSERDGDAQPQVVGHEDEHQQVADDDLRDVQRRLDEVREAEHARAATQGQGEVRGVL